MSPPTNASTPQVPAPWTLKGTIYSFMLYISTKEAANLASEKSFLYSPLEADSSFAENRPVGGLAMVQVIRYSESPVGPYDELVTMPGKFEHHCTATINGKPESSKHSNLLVTKAFVSQEKTCWNGRISKGHEMNVYVMNGF